jgi:hypothetical protein
MTAVALRVSNSRALLVLNPAHLTQAEQPQACVASRTPVQTLEHLPGQADGKAIKDAAGDEVQDVCSGGEVQAFLGSLNLHAQTQVQCTSCYRSPQSQFTLHWSWQPGWMPDSGLLLLSLATRLRSRSCPVCSMCDVAQEQEYISHISRPIHPWSVLQQGATHNPY